MFELHLDYKQGILRRRIILTLFQNDKPIWKREWSNSRLYDSDNPLEVFRDICQVNYDLRPCKVSPERAAIILLGVYD